MENSTHMTSTVRLRAWRMTKDVLARYGVAVGGVGVIIALLLIFLYLFSVVIPLFRPAHISKGVSYPIPGPTGSQTLYLAMEELHEIGSRFTDDGKITFFDTSNGHIVLEQVAPIPHGTRITSFATGSPRSGIFAYGLSDGSALIGQHFYKVTYPGDKRLITPHISYPFGETPLSVTAQGPLVRLAVQADEDGGTLAGLTESGSVEVVRIGRIRSFLSDEVRLDITHATAGDTHGPILDLLVPPLQRSLYVAYRSGEVDFFDITEAGTPRKIQTVRVTEPGEELTAITLLTGGISLICGTSTGRIAQWFPVRSDKGAPELTFIRDFHAQDSPITGLAPEYGRKGFLTSDAKGALGIYHATAHRVLLTQEISPAGIATMAVSPRADALLAQADDTIQFRLVDNEHPDISWHTLWQKVWYENYEKPAYVWQSSAATDDFEPKFSLVPITFGTLKAAFYAMLFAIPLAILGAIYTAHFMRPAMRRIVKPSIEIMEALPTVILGFLAGLWLAPYAEAHLVEIFLLILLMFPAIFLASYLWSLLPLDIRSRIPEGWEAAFLVPVVITTGFIAHALAPGIENVFFGGNIREWITHDLGISYDQRNCLIVGIAMGFAVIPVIFSITEDAIFGVPKHLTQGSLALGATPWQTLQKVVLLTASPGIFSAVMMGLGRAVGETMIVLMATGNTPIMDLNIFQGFRSLSANIAVEMPEAEVASTHFRILFLSGLVLFGLTFIFNTLAEVVRHRLRKRYSTL